MNQLATIAPARIIADDDRAHVVPTQMANHASTRTTQLYDRRRGELSLDEVERIRV